MEVTLPAAGPEEPDPSVDHRLLDKLVLLPRLNTDQVHAVTTTDVPTRDPVNLQVLTTAKKEMDEINRVMIFLSDFFHINISNIYMLLLCHIFPNLKGILPPKIMVNFVVYCLLFTSPTYFHFEP